MLIGGLFCRVFAGIPIKCGIIEIDIFLIHFFLTLTQAFAEALEMDDLPLTQEANDVVYVGIVGKAKDVVIGFAGFLFSGQIFGQIGDHVTGRLDGSSRPREAGGGRRIDACRVIHEIARKQGIGTNLLIGQIAGQLVHNSGYHFKVSQFFRTCRGGAMEERDGIREYMGKL